MIQKYSALAKFYIYFKGFDVAYVKIYIHFIWSTKNREQFLNTPELRVKIWNHILENAKSKGIYIDFINGFSDHCHCLISLGVDQSVQNVIQLIKGESSYWINKNKLTKYKFEWQDEYFALSVSESMLDKVRHYIKNQEIHHKKKSFQDEYNDFIKKYNFTKIIG